MKSRITIELDFDNGRLPIIKILQRQSSDVRDAILQDFLQSLNHTSRWCRIEYKGNHPVSSEDGAQDASYQHSWCITPVLPSEIENEMRLMEALLKTKK